MPFQSLY